MGEAFDDFHDMMERADTYCKKHKCWYEELGFGCPKCEYEAEESVQTELDPVSNDALYDNLDALRKDEDE